MFKQLVTINTSVTDQVGYCLRFARKVPDPDAPAGPEYAWDSWEMAKYKHTDRNFPSVAVPVYFSFFVGAKNEGHVVWWIPSNGKFLSSPTSGTGQRWLDTIEQVEASYHVKFVGWTEDINGLRVAEQVADPAPAPAASQKMPAINSSIQLVAPVTRTTYKAGTTTVAGEIKATNDQYVYIVRGYDPVYPGRIIINSASAGGNGVSLALYYTNGQLIDGWKQR